MNSSYVTLAVSSSAGMLEYLSSLRDPRTLGWPVATDARIVFPLLFGYVYIVTAAGPRWMKDRKPFDLTWAILIFNALSAVVNVFFCYQFLRHTYLGGGYSLFCQGIDYERRSETDMNLLLLQLAVRLREDGGLPGHVLLRGPEEDVADHRAARAAPLPGGLRQLAVPELRHRRPVHAARLPEHVRARDHVLVLLPGRPGPLRAQVPLVEALPHAPADRPVRRDDCAHVDTHIPRLRLPQSPLLRGSCARPPGSVAVPQLLH
ncbi:hypothetical protein HPB48_025441 [Haemaphysalis longicornis]|uniref:Very-long-chain 3-oxoacyl-CoA synthase n=1 Tax=Haemaphysalis longicornis TaxID=44386 RepID=A0A9J6H7N0_HAELO|nr:hypothetical protein HPB48_025441 [Haemaphysalis longicornis]